MSKPIADEEMRKLRLKRGQHKATITRIDNFVRDPVSFAAASVDILEARKEALVNALKAYETVQLDILSMDERDIEEVGVVEDKYFSVLAKINASLKSLSTKKVSECQNVSSCKLPTIEIPIFDGKDFTKFRPFYDLFMAIIDQNSVLSHVQKLFYLRKYLADDALAVIVNLPLVNESYKQALDLLSKRFDNKARLVSNHIGILLDLPILQKGTATSIRSFVSHIKQQLHALQNLNEPIDKWDMILISIFTRKLDPVTNRAYQLDRDSENMPSMANFLDFLEKRAIALEDSSIPQRGACYEGAPNTSKVYKSLPPKVTNVVTKNVKTCKFCNKPNHAIFSCPEFKTAALKDRQLFVRDHELCQTCLKPHSGGGCKFPEGWTGTWFQSGYPGLISINTSHIHSKGECIETESYDKFLLYEKTEDCYRCMVIHEKHRYVLQYKETYCSPKDSLSSICESISGDAPLYSMFRKDPKPVPQPCPFRPAPFTFVYSRGSGDCANPPSRAESCTDDSRLLLRYMACPDVPGTESNVEELVCLATWKEGSTRYLVGQISQVQRRNSIASDEDTYRCFIYKGQHSDKSMTYTIAQSGDATCNGLSSPTDGSRTMKLTNSDDEHNRCHFPSWILDHHKWFSLDHSHQYHFTTKNATLKIMNADGSFEEKRLVCHSILEQKDKQHIKLVAHVTRGCESGHVCLKFYRREGNVLELQQGSGLWESPQDACSDTAQPPYITLITTSLNPMRCPIFGRYSVVNSIADRRRRRQQHTIGDPDSSEMSNAAECVAGDYDSASVGCGAAQDTIEFKSSCTSTVYTCYGSWLEGNAGYLIAAPVARGSTHPKTLCFMYTHHTVNDTRGVTVQYLSMSAVARSCDRSVQPGVAGDKAYNLTINGTCEQSSKYNSLAHRIAPAAILLTSLLIAVR